MSRTWSRRFKMIEQNPSRPFSNSNSLFFAHFFCEQTVKFLKKCTNCSPLWAATALSRTMDGGGKEWWQLPVTNPITSRERERREINLFPITWEILFVAHKEILFDNQNKSSSAALLCSDLVVLQPFQPGNWKRLLKNRSMVNSNYCMVLQLFLFPIQIRN